MSRAERIEAAARALTHARFLGDRPWWRLSNKQRNDYFDALRAALASPADRCPVTDTVRSRTFACYLPVGHPGRHQFDASPADAPRDDEVRELIKGVRARKFKERGIP